MIKMRIEQEFIDEDFLYEMLNLSRRKFKKLPTNIFMSARNGSKHGPRIKIQNNYAENMQSENTFTRLNVRTRMSRLLK